MITDKNLSPVNLRAFDYVEDVEGNIFVVRAPLPGSRGELIAKIVHTSLPEAHLQHEPLPCLGSGTYKIDRSCVSRTYRRDQIAIRDLPNAPPEVISIAEVVKELGGRTFLHGSRRLGNEHETSDWDILINTHSPRRILSQIQHALGENVRSFDQGEVRQRVLRYAHNMSPFTVSALEAIFRHTTWYLKAKTYEIGVFFIQNNDTKLPAFPRHLLSGEHPVEATSILSLVGTPLSSGGTSYLMPRRVRFDVEGQDVITLTSLRWELGGLECASKLKLRLRSASVWYNHEWWLDSPYLRVEVL